MFEREKERDHSTDSLILHRMALMIKLRPPILSTLRTWTSKHFEDGMSVHIVAKCSLQWKIIEVAGKATSPLGVQGNLDNLS